MATSSAILSIISLQTPCMILRSDIPEGSTDTTNCGRGKVYHLDDAKERPAFVGFAILALFLLILSALLAGLTLAVCSLDLTYLQVLSTTSNEKLRSQVLVISRIRRNWSWFLCSFIICSVACTQSLPLIVLSLFGSCWFPIVVSTIAVAIFAELLPQYLIPRFATSWVYYCWPFIWGCMWLTSLISWPLAFFLDRIAGRQKNRSIYTNDQLGILIKFHERAEKHGGLLGPDAGRVMRGALDLDGRMLRGSNQPNLGKVKGLPELDVERGNSTESDIIVPWLSVRRININDEVTKELIQQIKGWAYSRIPVIGDIEVPNSECSDSGQSWHDQKVYGFLHVKNLVGLDLHDEHCQPKRLYVKDLPLYPLPVVRDDLPLYDLLNMFQLGMSRMAVVIPRPTKDRLAPLSASAQNQDALPRHGAPLWSAATGLNTRCTIEMRALDAQVDWTIDFLDAAQNDLKVPQHRKQSVIGIGCPKPIGIVTYEDVIDTLLQKTSRDEKDFFDRNTHTPPTKGRKEGDDNSVSSCYSVVRTRKAVPIYVQKLHAAFERGGPGAGTLRRRNVSAAAGGNDGPDDISEFDGAQDRSGYPSQRVTDDGSSYTQNSRGGFHRTNNSAECIPDASPLSSEELLGSKVAPHKASTDISSASTVRRTPPGLHSAEFTLFPRRSSRGRATLLPRLHHVTPFSRDNFSNFERMSADEQSEQRSGEIPAAVSVPEPAPFVVPHAEHRQVVCLDGAFDLHPQQTAETVSVYSWNGSDALTLASRYCRDDPPGSTLARAVAPDQSILENSPLQDNSVLAFSPKILPRVRGTTAYITAWDTEENENIPLKAESFHDDRTSLPSQRKGQIRSPQPGGGRGRRASLWC